jgi:hypothetical protein
MQNISKEMYRYLEAKRHLWNTYFLDIMDLSKYEPLDSYEAIERRLFFALVCNPLGIEYDPTWAAHRMDRILVRPRDDLSQIPLRVAIEIRRWEVDKLFPAKGLSLVYQEFFQWDRYEFLTLPLVRCEITEFDAHPEYIGKEVLVEHLYIDFWLSP